jgi:hypothetical protein
MSYSDQHQQRSRAARPARFGRGCDQVGRSPARTTARDSPCATRKAKPVRRLDGPLAPTALHLSPLSRKTRPPRTRSRDAHQRTPGPSLQHAMRASAPSSRQLPLRTSGRSATTAAAHACLPQRCGGLGPAAHRPLRASRAWLSTGLAYARARRPPRDGRGRCVIDLYVVKRRSTPSSNTSSPISKVSSSGWLTAAGVTRASCGNSAGSISGSRGAWSPRLTARIACPIV